MDKPQSKPIPNPLAADLGKIRDATTTSELTNLLPIMTPGTAGAPSRVIRKVLVVDPSKIRKLGLDQKIIQAVSKLKGNTSTSGSSNRIVSAAPLNILNKFGKQSIVDDTVETTAAKKQFPTEPSGSTIVPPIDRSSWSSIDVKTLLNKKIRERFQRKQLEQIESSSSGSVSGSNGTENSPSESKFYDNEKKIAKQIVPRLQDKKIESNFQGFTGQEVQESHQLFTRISDLIIVKRRRNSVNKTQRKRRISKISSVEDSEADFKDTGEFSAFNNWQANENNRKILKDHLEGAPCSDFVISRSCGTTNKEAENPPGFKDSEENLSPIVESLIPPLVQNTTNSKVETIISNKLLQRRNIPTAILKLGKRPAAAVSSEVRPQNQTEIVASIPKERSVTSIPPKPENIDKNRLCRPIGELSDKTSRFTVIDPVPLAPNINVVAIEEPINSSTILDSLPSPPPQLPTISRSSNKGIVVLDQQVFKPGTAIPFPLPISTKSNPNFTKFFAKQENSGRDNQILLKVLDHNVEAKEIKIEVVQRTEPPMKDISKSICKSYVKRMMKPVLKQTKTNPVPVQSNIQPVVEHSIAYDIQIIDNQPVVRQMFETQPLPCVSNEEKMNIRKRILPRGISDTLEAGRSLVTNPFLPKVQSQEKTSTHTGIVPSSVEPEPVDAVEFILNCTLNNAIPNDETMFEGEEDIAGVAWDDDDDEDEKCIEESPPPPHPVAATEIQHKLETTPTKSPENTVYEFQANPQVIDLIEHAEIAFQSNINSSPRLLSVIDLTGTQTAEEANTKNEIIESTPPKKRKRTIFNYINASTTAGSVDEMTERIKQRIAEKGKLITNKVELSKTSTPVELNILAPRVEVIEKGAESNQSVIKSSPPTVESNQSSGDSNPPLVESNLSPVKSNPPSVKSHQPPLESNQSPVKSSPSSVEINPPPIETKIQPPAIKSRRQKIVPIIRNRIRKPEKQRDSSITDYFKATDSIDSTQSDNNQNVTKSKNKFDPPACRQNAGGTKSIDSGTEKSPPLITSASENNFEESNSNVPEILSTKSPTTKGGTRKKPEAPSQTTNQKLASPEPKTRRKSAKISEPNETEPLSSSYDLNPKSPERKSSRLRKPISNSDYVMTSLPSQSTVQTLLPAASPQESPPKLQKSRRKNTIPEIDKLTSQRRISVRSQKELLPYDTADSNSSTPPQHAGYSVMYSANFTGSVKVESKPNVEHVFRSPLQNTFPSDWNNSASLASPLAAKRKYTKTPKAEVKAKSRTMRISSEVELVEPGALKIQKDYGSDNKTQIWQKRKNFANRATLKDYEINPRLLVATSRDELRAQREVLIEHEAIDGIVVKDEFELSEDSVRCGVCKFVMNGQFFTKHLRQHYGVGWREGIDTPINLTSYREVICGMDFYFLRNKIESVKCKFCGVEKKSAKGIFSHLLVCGATEDELNVLMDSCEHCGKKFLPHALWTHLTSCRSKRSQEDDPNDSEEAGVPSGKRKSSIKANSSFKDMLMNDTYRLKADDLIKRFFLSVGGLSRKWTNQIKQTGMAKCNQLECQYQSPQIGDLKQHLKSCPYQRRGGFTCMRCQFYDLNEENVRKHVLEVHDSLLTVDLPVVSKDTRKQCENALAAIKAERNDPSFNFAEINESDSGLQDDEMEESSFDDEASDRSERPGKSEKSSPMLPMHFYKYKQAVANHREFYVTTCELRKEMYSDRPLYYGSIPNEIIISKKSFESFAPANSNSMRYKHVNVESINTEVGSTRTSGNWTRIESFAVQILGDESLLYIGGPITNCVWVPMPATNVYVEYLAITYKHDFESHVKFSQPRRKDTLVLIYRLDIGSNKMVSNIELVYGLEVNAGPIHHIAFLPSGGYTPELNRLGLLAIASIDNDVEIYSLPLKVDENCDTTFNSNKLCTVVRIKPSLVLCVDLREKCHRSDKEFFSQCRRLVWSEMKDHNIIAGGYLNGFIGLWDIRDSAENLTRFDKNGCAYFVPVAYFKAIGFDVTGLDFHYSLNGPRWMSVSSSIRETQVYDLEDITNPKLIAQEGFQKAGISDTVWPLYTESPHFAMDDDYMEDNLSTIAPSIWNITYKVKHNIHASTGFYRLTYTPWHNAIIAACRNGDIIIQRYNSMSAVNFSNSYEKKHIFFTDIVRCDGSKIPLVDAKILKAGVSDETLEMLDDFDRESIEKYGLVFSGPILYYRTNKKVVISSKRSPPFPLRPLTRIDCISICPNQSNTKLLAFGYHNGLIRIKLVDFNQFL